MLVGTVFSIFIVFLKSFNLTLPNNGLGLGLKASFYEKVPLGGADGRLPDKHSPSGTWAGTDLSNETNSALKMKIIANMILFSCAGGW